MTDFTTEQKLPVSFKLVDGRGRPAPIDGTPAVVSSDETVASVSDLADAGNGSWSFNVNSVAEGTARIALTADADISSSVSEVVGTLEVNITLDPRTAARTIELTPGTPVDD